MLNYSFEDSVLISLNSINKVKDFSKAISTVNKKEMALDLISGRYVVDATSILGIFSLDLTKPIELKIYAISEELIEKIKKNIEDYIV